MGYEIYETKQPKKKKVTSIKQMILTINKMLYSILKKEV